MARVVSFCAKQMVGGNQGAMTIYSDVFDVTEASQLVNELRVYGVSATGSVITGQIQETSDPTLGDSAWSQLSTDFLQTGTGVQKSAIANPQRFVRAKITIPSGVYATMCWQAIAREAT
jgi:hypothetical protein